MFEIKNSENLQKHIFATYINIRYGAAIIAFVFPLLLWFGGQLVYKVPQQCSMSAYYHADENTPHCNKQEALIDQFQETVKQNPESGDQFPLGKYANGKMRNFFVGLLFMLGGIFYLYKGYSDKENIALNSAGIFAVCVALIPMDWTGKASGFSWHGASAVLLFLCIAFVCIFCAHETLDEMSSEYDKMKKFLSKCYKAIGVLMVILPLGIWLYLSVVGQSDAVVFYVEMIGIWVFALYWFLKSWELSKTHADQKALSGSLHIKK